MPFHPSHGNLAGSEDTLIHTAPFFFIRLIVLNMLKTVAGTFGPKKGSTLSAEEVVWMPSLVQSRHYFLLRKMRSKWRDIHNLFKPIWTRRTSHLSWNCRSPHVSMKDMDISDSEAGGQACPQITWEELQELSDFYLVFQTFKHFSTASDGGRPSEFMQPSNLNTSATAQFQQSSSEPIKKNQYFSGKKLFSAWPPGCAMRQS